MEKWGKKGKKKGKKWKKKMENVESWKLWTLHHFIMIIMITIVIICQPPNPRLPCSQISKGVVDSLTAELPASTSLDPRFSLFNNEPGHRPNLE